MPKGPAPAYNVAAGHDPLGQPPGERFSGGSRGRYRITVLCAWATGTPFPTGPPWWWGGDLAGRHSAPWEAGPLPVNARAWGSLHSAVFRDRACPPLLTDQVVSSSHEIPSPSPQWRSACLPDNAHHTAAMVAPSASGGGPRVCWKVERACSVASGRVPALETRQPGASECAWPGEVTPRRVWTLCPGPHPSLLFRGISRAPLCGCLIGSRYTSLLPRILTNSAETRPEPCLQSSVSCLLLESPRATET